MKAAIFILSLFLSLTVFAQTIDGSEHRIKFGLAITPEYNNLRVKNLVGQESVATKIGFSTSLQVEFCLTNSISLRSGFGYGLKNYYHTHSGLIFGTDLNPVTGVNTTTTVESEVSFSEFQIPLIFQYELKENKLFISGGMEFT